MRAGNALGSKSSPRIHARRAIHRRIRRLLGTGRHTEMSGRCRTDIPHYNGSGRATRVRTVLFTLALIVAGVMTARSQTSVNPATTTTEFGGQPNLTNAPADFTVP